ncbi:hypothetical protein RP20_CCG021345 [Aedes albopictus]|nr:hypothetical protein RP20_CCG021345 [Aedes albopictus]
MSIPEEDQLKPIPRTDWTELRDMFKREWPKHEVAYNSIQNYMNWVTIEPRIKNLEVLGLNDSWRDNGTYVIVDRYQVFLYSLDESDESLKRALLLVDWDYSYMICCVHESRHSVLKEVFKLHEVDFKWEAHSILYELPLEDCLNLNVSLPEGLHLRKLEEKHLSIANKHWPWRHEGSEYFLKRIATWNISLGLFNECDELLAWCFLWPTGAIGPLEVAKNQLRKGYGSLILKAMAKEVAKIGLNCYGTVFSGNSPSVAMFEKAGFQSVDKHYFVRTRAKKLVEFT